MSVTILAIESSCDETAAAIIQNGKVLNNKIATQSVHKNYGGVVPELASRAHHVHIVPVVEASLTANNVKIAQIDAFAFTQGPGLLGALMVGCNFAKSLALAMNKPLLAVNHMQAHIHAHFIEDPKPSFPFLCLTVSGGHTQLVLVKNPLEMEIVGQSLDDAVGEAFDKSAKLLGLSYPGGPLLDHLAQKGRPIYPFPMSEMPNFDFSFSGIKTAILYFLQKEVKRNPDFVTDNLNDICASIQDSLVRMLLKTFEKAADHFGVQELAIAGGVSANSLLRYEVVKLGERRGWKTYIPQFQYCTDNAAMVAMTAHFKYVAGEYAALNTMPNPRLTF